MWCPKFKKDRKLNHFYETMKMVRPGDLVFSFAFTKVQGFGFAKTYCYSSPRPNEFGQIGMVWDKTGWRCDVDFKAFPIPFSTQDFARQLAPLLPLVYSPIRENGYGNQGAYFAEIPKEMALLIAENSSQELFMYIRFGGIFDLDQAIETELVSRFQWEEIEQRKIVEEVIPETQKTALILARCGQGRFKKSLFSYEKACRITHVQNPAHLYASHIKPWRESNNEERLSPGNGLLLTPSIDHLFDRGFISFADDGELLVSPVADNISLQRMGVQCGQPFLTGSFNKDQKYFLDFHRQEIFLKSAS